MEDNNRNFLLAVALSIAVLILWHFFYAGPKMQEEQERLRKQQATTQQQAPTQQQTQGGTPKISDQSATPGTPSAAPGTTSTPQTSTTPQLSQTPLVRSRAAALSEHPRVLIDTPSLQGSVNLQGARLDDIILKKYRETVKKDSDNITLLSPSGSPDPYYAEHGWLAQDSDGLTLPGPNTLWTRRSQGSLTPTTPIILEYDNGKGLIFRRTISVDDNYMFAVKREVVNNTGKPATLYPYSLISRHSRPKQVGFFILHEGLVSVTEEAVNGCGWITSSIQCEITYDDAIDDPDTKFDGKTGWIGMTDKYWAAVLIPDQNTKYKASLTGSKNAAREHFQTHYVLDPITIAAGATGTVQDHLFAGAKQVHLVEKYGTDLNVDRLELLIDWGWFYFLTKPLFYGLDYFYQLVGNFGISILIVTLIIKLILYPLANKAYISMSRMKKLQPEVEKLKERYGEDKVKMQQEMMALYKKEKVNPLSGCLPILVQIPIFFALYKVLFVSIDMRHAPFFGWIQDLSAPDPTSLFNLFGLIPWDTPDWLTIGIWPIIMGLTMWVQMKLNPAQPDPVQQQIFAWMPVIFTVLLATFPAGLVIYWAWNNLLSIIQQWSIMRRQGVEVNLLENMGLAKFFGKDVGNGPEKSEKT